MKQIVAIVKPFRVEALLEALRRAPEMSSSLVDAGHPPIRDGEYHYLEVLREAAGGEPATIPIYDT